MKWAGQLVYQNMQFTGLDLKRAEQTGINVQLCTISFLLVQYPNFLQISSLRALRVKIVEMMQSAVFETNGSSFKSFVP